MSYLRDTAIVLRREPFREEDAWLTLFSKHHGKLEAVARSGHRLEAKALGHADVFSEVEVMIAKGRSFDKLAVVHLVRPRHNLRQSLPALIMAGGFLNLVDALTSF